MSKKIMMVIGGLILIILILTAVLIFRKPEKVFIDPGREKILLDSLNLLQQNIESSQARQDMLQRSYDSLLLIDQQVITRTRDKVHFIFADANPDDLDSIIRTNWKVNSRYR